MNAIKLRVRAGLLMIVAALAALGGVQGAQAAPFAAYVMDGRTGQMLYSQNADTPLHPASLTKMMTLYLAFAAIEQGRVRLDSRFTVSAHAASQPPSRLGLRPGQQIELRYLIRAAAVKSANDAATVIGEGLAGSEPKFAAQMTAMARALGMRNSQFRNANGLSAEGHYSSARDLTVLGRHLFYDFPQYYSIFSRRSADAGIAQVSSTNTRFLDSYAGADGIKTGYTRAAGFNLTASAQRGNKRIMATVMGGTSTAQRNQVMAQLLDAGFGRSPARVAEVPPNKVIVTPERVRRAAVAPAPVTAAAPVVVSAAAPAPRARAVASGPVDSAPPPGGVDLSAALREAMATRPAPSPDRASLASAATKPRRPPAESSASNNPAIEAAVLAASMRPAAKPEGSSPDSADTEDAAPPTKARRGASAVEAGTAPVRLAAADGTAARPTSRQASAGSANRGWAISLGRYRSAAEAEQLLLKTALRDGKTLDSATRKVASNKRGHEARFVGLTKAEAALTCDRLEARSQKCTVMQP